MQEGLTGIISKKQKLFGFFILFPCYLYFIPFIVKHGLLYSCQLFQITLNIETLNAVYNFLCTGISLIFICFLLKDFLKENVKAFKKDMLAHIIWTFSIGIALFYSLSIISNGIVQFFIQDPDAISSNQEIINSLLEHHILLMFIQTVLFAPILEELLFRGLIFHTLYTKSKFLAHFVTAFLFGFLHVYQAVLLGDISQMIYIISYGAMGLSFSIAYEKRNTICSAILLHMTNNLIALIINILLLRFS